MVKWVMVTVFTFALLGAVAAAAATLTVGGVDRLGSGSTEVLAPPGVEVIAVTWVLDPNDTSEVAQVEVTFAQVTAPNPCPTANPCDLYLMLKDGGATVIKVAGPLSLSTSTLGTVTVVWDGGLEVPASDIAFFAVTVVQ